MSDFQSEYGVRLRGWDGSWREFMALLAGLMACDSRLMRKFAEHESPSAGPDFDITGR